MVSEELKGVLAQMMRPLKNVSFDLVVEGLTNYQVLPFDDKAGLSHAFLQKINESIVATGQEFNVQQKTSHEIKSANEVGTYIENILLRNLQKSFGKSKARRPQTKSGKVRSSGYPDYEINFEEKWFYLECKTYEKRQVNSKFRTFYFSPSKDFKITRDAPHLLVAFEINLLENDNNSIFKISHYKLLDLKNIKVNMKYEFNSSNFEMYSNKANIICENSI